MKVFRLSRKKYAQDLSGKGAAKSGNRWNSKGTEMLYTAESRALAMAEVIVHLSLTSLPDDYQMIEIDIPDSLDVKVIEILHLEKNWNTHPPKISSQLIGDAFINDCENCILRVPSAVVKGDFNYLLNPKHKDIKRIRIIEISDFPFDQRFF